jgi:uncharacterized repeat protein (TIGR02543 family)
MRLLAFLLVLQAALVIPSNALADGRRVTDGADTRGALDIAWVAHGHAAGAVTHTLHTRRPFASRLLRRGSAVGFAFDTTGDGRIDRLALVVWSGGALRAAIADPRGRLLGLAAVTRPDRRTVTVSLSLRWFPQVSAYHWAALTLYRDKQRCAKTCEDSAPNRGSIPHQIATFHQLSVVVSGSGRVRSIGVGIDCPKDCSERYRQGSTVTLRPITPDGWVFSGWSGACSGTGDCTVTIDSATSVTATFVPLRTLTVATTGPGYVTVAPPDGPCTGGPCQFRFVAGTSVQLTASTGPSYVFDGWGGDCTGTATTCVVTMTGDRSVTAHFSVASFTLSVAVRAADGASGRVVSSAPGIDCPGDCAERYTNETYVTLFAIAGPESTFHGWQDSIWCQGSRPDCMVPMGAVFPGDKSVAAAFERAP